MTDTTHDTKAAATLSQQVAKFAHTVDANNLPWNVRQKAQLHLIDTFGLALASHAQDFAAPSLSGIGDLGSEGPCTVIGTPGMLTHRDAALANGILMHGLDFDDTHLSSIIHASVASLPTALAMAEHTQTNWENLIAAYAIGMETSIRIGAAIDGGFHAVGFHATGVVSHFSAAVVAAKLLNLEMPGIVAAQGIAASTASGVQVFLEEGAWTKRMHPGWGAVAGITAAYMARAGFAAPTRPYEGRFGLFDAYLQGRDVQTRFLDDFEENQWMMLETAIKPYPICHFNHGCAEAGAQLHQAVVSRIGDIRQIVAYLPQPTMHIVAEPAEEKTRVTTDYEAKFSVQYAVATTLLRGHFSLKELEPEAIADPATQNLIKRVICKVDTDSRFPRYFSGRVEVIFNDDTTIRADVPINKGVASREMSPQEIEQKFLDNASCLVTETQALRLLQVLHEANNKPVAQIMAAFRL